MYRLACLLLVVAAAAAESVVKTGPCPILAGVQNFNLTAYQGLWYEIQKYPYDAEKKGKCATVEYKMDGDLGKIKNTHVVDGIQLTVEGTVKMAADANNTAKLVVTLKLADKTRESTIVILGTDYTSYSVAYNCKYDDASKSHQDFAWVLSRTKTLEGISKTSVDTLIKSTTELDATKLIPTDFSEEACKFIKSTTITQ